MSCKTLVSKRAYRLENHLKGCTKRSSEDEDIEDEVVPVETVKMPGSAKSKTVQLPTASGSGLGRKRGSQVILEPEEQVRPLKQPKLNS